MQQKKRFMFRDVLHDQVQLDQVVHLVKGKEVELTGENLRSHFKEEKAAKV